MKFRSVPGESNKQRGADLSADLQATTWRGQLPHRGFRAFLGVFLKPGETNPGVILQNQHQIFACPKISTKENGAILYGGTACNLQVQKPGKQVGKLRNSAEEDIDVGAVTLVALAPDYFGTIA